MCTGPPSPLPASPESITSVFIYFDSSNIGLIDMLMLPTKQTNWAGVYYLISRVLMQKIYWCWTGHTHAIQQACNVEKMNDSVGLYVVLFCSCHLLFVLDHVCLITDEGNTRTWSDTASIQQFLMIKSWISKWRRNHSAVPPHTKFSGLPSAKADYIKLHFFLSPQ